MITTPIAQWLLCAVFTLTGAYSLFWAVRPSSLSSRISHTLHVLMAAAMAVMVWPWGMGLLLVPQMAIFTVAAAWFAYQYFSHAGPMKFPGSDGAHHSGKGALAYHAGMMAAMVIMAAAMGSASTTTPGMDAMGSMPGMDMSAHSMDAGMTTPLWASSLSAVCAAGFGIAILFHLGTTLACASSPQRQNRQGLIATSNAVWNLLMAAGMAALFLPLINFG